MKQYQDSSLIEEIPEIFFDAYQELVQNYLKRVDLGFWEEHKIVNPFANNGNEEGK